MSSPVPEQNALPDLNGMDADATNFEEEFAENPDPRAACVLAYDCSDSMAMTGPNDVPDASNPQTAMYKLNTAQETLITEVRKDPLTSSRLEISILPYGTEVAQPQPFKSVEDLMIPDLKPMHLTSTGLAIETGLDMIEKRKAEYKAVGADYYRPFFILMSDGMATDMPKLKEVLPRLHEMEQKKQVAFFPIAINETAKEAMKDFSCQKPPLLLKDMDFSSFFVWLSASQAAVSSSNPGDKVALPDPTGWGEI